MARSRASKGQLLPPMTQPTHSTQVRIDWLTASRNGFVTTTPANKRYYSAILDLLWPSGHGIPGPHVSQEDIRAEINRLRVADGEDPYIDPFRRMRELQGEEGFTGIVKEGVKYQLQTTVVGTKRAPRTKPSKKLWTEVKTNANFRCAVCGGQEPSVQLSPDHRIPRSRGGLNDDANWQPLCEQCNNAKSAACAGCAQNCSVCPWAFPQQYKPIVISDTNRELLRRLSDKRGVYTTDLANSILQDYFNKK